MSSKQSGFSIIEGVIAIVVVGVLGFIGWRLYTTYYGKQSTTTTSNKQGSRPTTSNTTTADPYSGWKTYCSTSGGLCLHYPTDWQEQDTVSQASDTTAADVATISSPSGSLEVIYNPYLYGIGAGCPDNTCFFTTKSISQTYTPNSVGLKVYSGVWTNSASIVPFYFISSDKQMSYYKLQLNQKVETHAFDTPFRSPIDNTSIEAISVRDIPAKSYASTSDAEAWFNRPEVVTSGQILNSVYVNPAAKPASWLTYASQVGNFTINYPSTWTLDTTVGDPVYGKGSVIRLTNNSSDGNFGMDIHVTDQSGIINQGTTFDKGTTTTLLNGITLWQENQNVNYATQTGSSSCPSLKIGKDNSFSMQLKNGKYLSVYGSFCWGQGISTSASYQNQVNSQTWKDATTILTSIKFN